MRGPTTPGRAASAVEASNDRRRRVRSTESRSAILAFYSPPPSVPHVQVNGRRVPPSRSHAPAFPLAGSSPFKFVNHGQDEHNLNSLSSTEEDRRLVGNTVSDGLGNIEVDLKRGSYTLFCSLPEHEQKGMKATLTVE